MALEVLKCPNCGAPMPANVVEAVVVCGYCTRSVANPAAMSGAARPAHADLPAAPEAHAAPPAAPAAPPQTAAPAQAKAPAAPAQAPVAKPVAAPAAAVAATAAATPAKSPLAKSPLTKSPMGKPAAPPAAAPTASAKIASKGGGAAADGLRKRSVEVEADEEGDDEEEWEWTEENIIEYARESLGERDSLFFEPNVPKDKLKNARATHKHSLERDERVLVLYDDTVFGGADDGFVITTNQVAWKNIGDDPKHFAWEEIDPDAVEWTEESLTVMGEEIQITQGDSTEFYPAVGEFIQEMAATAQELEEEDDE